MSIQHNLLCKSEPVVFKMVVSSSTNNGGRRGWVEVFLAQTTVFMVVPDKCLARRADCYKLMREARLESMRRRYCNRHHHHYFLIAQSAILRSFE